jgi:hypothetical protein
MTGSTLDHLIPRACGAPTLDDGHPEALPGVPADRTIQDAGTWRRLSPDDGKVGAPERPLGELRRQRTVGRVVASRQHQARGALVEPVHDAWPSGSAAGRPLPSPPQQRVYQGAGAVTGRRVDHHAGRLVDDDQVGVLVDDPERDGLRAGRHVDLLRPLVFEQITLPHAVRRPGRPPVDPDEAGARQASGRGAAQRRVQRGEDAVDPPDSPCYLEGPALWRRTYPISSSTTPTEMAESATLKTGQKWSAMKSVTVPCRRRS